MFIFNDRETIFVLQMESDVHDWSQSIANKTLFLNCRLICDSCGSDGLVGLETEPNVVEAKARFLQEFITLVCNWQLYE